MRRGIVQVFAAIVAAGIIGTALTVLLWDDDEPIAMQTASPTATAMGTTAPPLTLPPSATPKASASPSGTAAATSMPTTRPSGQTPPPVQPASSVDCNRTPSFCTNTTGMMEIQDDKLVSSGTQQHSIDYSSVPNTSMTWHITKEGGGDAQNGDDVDRLLVTVEIFNDTNSTWVIPRREVVLVVMLDGDELHKLVTSGADFEMRPGGRLTANYTIPLAFEGKYTWRGNTSFYKK